MLYYHDEMQTADFAAKFVQWDGPPHDKIAHPRYLDLYRWIVERARTGDAKAQWVQARAWAAHGGNDQCGAPLDEIAAKINTPAGRNYRPSRNWLAVLYGERRAGNVDAVAKGSQLFQQSDDDAARLYQAAVFECGLGVARDAAKAQALYSSLQAKLTTRAEPLRSSEFRTPDDDADVQLADAVRDGLAQLAGRDSVQQWRPRWPFCDN